MIQTRTVNVRLTSISQSVRSSLFLCACCSWRNCARKRRVWGSINRTGAGPRRQNWRDRDNKHWHVYSVRIRSQMRVVARTFVVSWERLVTRSLAKDLGRRVPRKRPTTRTVGTRLIGIWCAIPKLFELLPFAASTIVTRCVVDTDHRCRQQGRCKRRRCSGHRNSLHTFQI